MSEYDLRPVPSDEATLARMTALLAQVFPRSAHFTQDVLRWQYRENPAGEAVGYNAWLGEELAAHYVTIPLLAEVEGRTQRGLLSLNTATHPSHQGKGLFTRLATATYERAAKEGSAFVIGVANANSTHGFTKKLGFQLVAPLRAMYGSGPLPKVNDQAPVGYRQLWTAASVAWRLAHPAYRYSVSEGRRGPLVLSQRDQWGARYVVSALPELPLPTELLGERTPFRKVWIGLEPRMRWPGSLYMNIPLRLRPSPLNLIFKDLTGQGRMLNADRVSFHAMDFDIL